MEVPNMIILSICCKGSIFLQKIKNLKNVKRVCPKIKIKGQEE